MSERFRFTGKGHLTLFRERAPCFCTIAQGGFDIDRLSRRSDTALGSREREQPIDDPRESVGFTEGGREVCALFGIECVLEILKAQAQRGERRAELMGGVGQECPLSVDELLQAVRHLIDSLAERIEFSRTSPSRGPLGQAAGADGGHGCFDALQGVGKGSRENRPEGSSNGEHAEPEEAECQPVVPDTCVESRRRLGDEKDDVGP